MNDFNVTEFYMGFTAALDSLLALPRLGVCDATRQIVPRLVLLLQRGWTAICTVFYAFTIQPGVR